MPKELEYSKQALLNAVAHIIHCCRQYEQHCEYCPLSWELAKGEYYCAFATCTPDLFVLEPDEDHIIDSNEFIFEGPED